MRRLGMERRSIVGWQVLLWRCIAVAAAAAATRRRKGCERCWVRRANTIGEIGRRGTEGDGRERNGADTYTVSHTHEVVNVNNTALVVAKDGRLWSHGHGRTSRAAIHAADAADLGLLLLLRRELLGDLLQRELCMRGGRNRLLVRGLLRAGHGWELGGNGNWMPVVRQCWIYRL